MKIYLIFSKSLNQFLSNQDMIDNKDFFEYRVECLNTEKISETEIINIIDQSIEFVDYRIITEEIYKNLK